MQEFLNQSGDISNGNTTAVSKIKVVGILARIPQGISKGILRGTLGRISAEIAVAFLL